MNRSIAISVILVVAAACGGESRTLPLAKGPPPAAPDDLKSPDAFAGIANPEDRSKAIFHEAARVITSPRCVNCHPSDASPRQRDAHEMHDPPVTRGPKDDGVPGAQCETCHQDENALLARIPGAPNWHLAPIQMAWLGRSESEICTQMKDPDRNGHRSLAQIVDHAEHDHLVAWGWSPGADRKPAPGSQEKFGALVAAWVSAGAACPDAPNAEAAR